MGVLLHFLLFLLERSCCAFLTLVSMLQRQARNAITVSLTIKITTLRTSLCMVELKIFVFWILHFDTYSIMATRNLTPEFNKYRQASGRKRPMNQSSSATSSLIGGEM